MKLLIVDDSLVIRNKISRILGGKFSTIQRVTNGSNALAEVHDWRPDLITMDLTMPEMDGVACIKHINAHDSTIPILVVSALSDKNTAIEALSSGANGFLSKPFKDIELKAAIYKVLELDLSDE